MEDIPSYVKHWAQTHPQKEVFVFFNETGGRSAVYTPLDVYEMAGRFASRLKEMGFRKGDVIGNAMKNCPERVVTDMGVMMAGCAVSNLQVLEMDGSDLWKTLQCNKCAGIILPVHHSNAVYNVIAPLLPDTPATHNRSSPSSIDNVALPNAPSVKRIIFVSREEHEKGGLRSKSFLQTLREDSSDDILFIHPDIRPSDLAYIFPTSGTSGISKLVPRTHEDVLRIARVFESSPPSKRYCPNQLGWVGGFPFTFLGSCSCTLIQDCFTGKANIGVQETWDLIEKEECTAGFMFPPDLEKFIAYFKRNGPSQYRFKVIITGGYPLSKRLVSGILEYLSEGVAISYAATETWAITNTYIRSVDEMQDFKAGVPWAGVRVKVVDENMAEVEPCQSGQVLVKSPFGVRHYYNQPTDKPMCTDDGYYVTGDRGWLDQDGVLYVTDRIDNVIINGIISVYPGWPENVLAKIPGVAEAVVIGIPRPDGVLSKVCACVILQRDYEITEQTLVASYNERFTAHVSDASVPKLDQVEFFTSFPRTDTGKVKRRQLRHLVLERMKKTCVE